MTEKSTREEVMRAFGDGQFASYVHTMLEHPNLNLKAAALWGLANVTTQQDKAKVRAMLNILQIRCAIVVTYSLWSVAVGFAYIHAAKTAQDGPFAVLQRLGRGHRCR